MEAKQTDKANKNWPFCNETFVSKDGKLSICQLKRGHEERGREGHSGAELVPMRVSKMSAEDKLTYIYQWVENRMNAMDKMTAIGYNRLNPATELKAVLRAMDLLDEGYQQ